MSFDSILVRLKVSSLGNGETATLSFDSILVRLKAQRNSETQRENKSFDSILVRLKATPLLTKNLMILVSIPYWFD